MAFKHWNLEANEEAGQQKELKTHFEVVSKETIFTHEMAMAVKSFYEKYTGKKFEVREVAE